MLMNQKQPAAPKRISGKFCRSLLGLAVACLFFGLAGFLIYANHKKFETTLMSQIEQQLLTIAKTTVGRMNEYLTDYKDILKTIAANPLVQEETCRKTIEDLPLPGYCPIKALYLIHSQKVDSLLITDNHGLLLHGHPEIYAKGEFLRDNPGLAYVLKEHKPYLSQAHPHGLTKLAISISEPIFYKTDFVGVVQWIISLDTISRRFVESLDIGQRGYAWICTKEGTIIAHPQERYLGQSILDLIPQRVWDDVPGGEGEKFAQNQKDNQNYLQKILYQEEGRGLFFNHLTGELEIITFKRLPLGQETWVIIISLPYAEIAGSLIDNEKNVLMLAGLFIFLISVAGAFFYISRKRRIQFEAETAYLKRSAEAAEALRESEEKLTGIIASVPDYMTIIDERYHVFWANEVAKDYFGPQFVGHPCYTSIFERQIVCEQCPVRQCFQDGRIHEQEIEIIAKDGQKKFLWCIANVTAWHKDGRARLVVEVFRDITERKRAEHLLLQEKNKARQYLDVAGVILVVIGADGQVVLINKEGSRILEYEEPEIIGRNWFTTFIPESSRKEVKRLFYQLISGEVQPGGHFESPLLTKSGRLRVVAWRVAILNDENEEILGALYSGEDITEQRLVEKERIRLATAIEQITESVIITGPDLNIEYVNPAFEHISGYSRQEVLGSNINALSTQPENEESRMCMWNILASGGVWKGQVTNRKKDGSSYETEEAISPIKDNSNNIINYIAIQRDITHEHILERQLRQAQKMEAIGTLAGGVAHDFNNILAAIVGFTQMTIFDLPKHNVLRNNLLEVLKASNRAKDLVRQILTFSRQGEQKKEPVQVSSIIEEGLKLLRASLPSTILIESKINSGEGTILADPIQLHQIIINLCTNGAHAMRDKGGTLTVALNDLEITAQDLKKYPEIPPGPYLQLTVADTGHGISTEIIDRIFDPFFTTKAPQEGTGMGLAAVHGIVKSHGGRITVDSIVGQGSIFSIYLPRIESNHKKPGQVIKNLPTGHERLLFIDDEKALAAIGQEMLKRLGYQVMAHTSSLEAIEAFRQQPYIFDLIITDQTMPYLTGLELAKECLAIRPQIPTILCTGYSEKISPQEVARVGIRELIMKPYDIYSLAQAIRSALLPQD